MLNVLAVPDQFCRAKDSASTSHVLSYDRYCFLVRHRFDGEATEGHTPSTAGQHRNAHGLPMSCQPSRTGSHGGTPRCQRLLDFDRRRWRSTCFPEPRQPMSNRIACDVPQMPSCTRSSLSWQNRRPCPANEGGVTQAERPTVRIHRRREIGFVHESTGRFLALSRRTTGRLSRDSADGRRSPLSDRRIVVFHESASAECVGSANRGCPVQAHPGTDIPAAGTWDSPVRRVLRVCLGDIRVLR